jgi:hypothetical protein
MASKSKRARLAPKRNIARTLLYWAISVFIIKLIIIINIPQGIQTSGNNSFQIDGIWLGADGENYLNSLEGLLKDGIFSEQGNLHYWPAGYPILMWPLAELSFNNLAFLVGTLQSLIFAVSVIFFSFELSKSSLKRFTWPAVIILSLSPTFTLNSVVIGYEVTSAVLFLLVIALYMRLIRIDKRSIFNWESSLAALAISVSCFMQPRIILLALGLFIPFAIYHYRGRAIPIFLAFSLFIVAIAPAILIFRNTQAQGFAAISTNLGVTMNIGAGPKASGGYTSQVTGVDCEPIEGDAAEQDSHKVGCVLKWYLKNPGASLKLFINKFFFH